MSIELGPIVTEADYEIALKRLEEVWGAPCGTPEGDLLDRLATLIEIYEEEHYPMDL